ncbi:choline/ethanolamine kinase [Trypanosoma rangeli SC58]|uniref:ethanolamine kinase n=1 Tax=Trypanosoma rangeli SC58 TaxID=429131 RepID=A0A061IXW7_TRYRA|nr:choline/ethanolamine kinase [Trypanosoma rangeli SC58]
MLLKGGSPSVPCNGMRQTGAQLTQCVIPDDDDERRVSIIYIALMYCSDVLFPTGSPPAVVGCPVFSESRGSDTNGFCAPSEDAVSKVLCVERLSGGITNELFRVYHPGNDTHSVVVRVFGKETERVITRESEFFYQSFFIPTYVRGRNFLIYQFLNCYRALSFTELSQEASKMACEVAAFQVRATLEAKCDHHNPQLSEEERAYWNAVGPTLGGGHAAVADVCRFDREENYTLHALTRWTEQMLSEGVLSKVCAGKRADYESVARQLKQEAVWVRSLLLRCAAVLGEGVCHNDLLAANIMRHSECGALKIIDFDYVKRNYFLFDIANHFNEYAGLECDYDRYFPSDAEMSSFIGVYRKAMRAELHRHREDARGKQLEEIIPGEKHFFLCETDDDEEEATIAYWVRLVKLLTLASHLSWGIWALLQEAVSTLDVDFLLYAKCRLKRYLETKDTFSLGFR